MHIENVIFLILSKNAYTKFSAGPHCFSSYLVSNLAFPNIKFSEENGNPLILIANHRENIASIPVALCKVLSHQHTDFRKGLNAERDRFVVRLFDLDYQIDMNYENRYIS